MRELTRLTRRQFGQGLGTVLALTGLPCPLRAHDGTHEVMVRIAGFAFDPPEIEILAGNSVTWINGDLAPHTATARDGSWETGPIDRDGQFTIIFDAPGTYPYVCEFHPQMQATIVVRPKAAG